MAQGGLDFTIVDMEHCPTSLETLAHCVRGYECAQQGDLGSAIAEYDAAIGLNPRYAVAYNNRGTARLEAGDYGRAIADCTTAIELAPPRALLGMAYCNRSAAYALQGDMSRSRPDLDRAIEIDPGLQDIWRQLIRRGGEGQRGEARPDHPACPCIAVHLGEDVPEDVGDGEEEHAGAEGDRSHLGHLGGADEVRAQEHGDEGHRHQVDVPVLPPAGWGRHGPQTLPEQRCC